MPTAPVKPYIPDERKRSRVRVDAWVPIVVLLAFVVIAAFSHAIQPGPFVGKVTVVNGSEYSFDVDVAGAKANDWMPLATAADHATTGISEVYQQGSTWTFRFSTQGEEVGRLVESRADLAKAGWRVVVPAALAQKLRAEGVIPAA